MPPTVTCNRCGADIIWTTTEKGKRMPVDAEPHPYIQKGYIVVDGIAKFRTRGGAAAEDTQLHRTHFLSCKPGV